VSCASEKLLGRSSATPPWVRETPTGGEVELLFVGQAVGRNVLDERTMRTRAMQDARQRVAGRLETRIRAETREVITRTGDAARGQDTADEQYVRELRTSVRQSIRGLALRATYWERWRVDPGLFSPSFTRYKYYALTAYPRAEYDRIISYFTRVTVDRERARELIAEGKPAEAAELLEKLLDDYPDAPVPVRLALAQAYERMGKPLRAEAVLEVGLELAASDAEFARVEERLQHLESIFPDLSGRSVYLTIEPPRDTALAVERAWVEEPCVRSNLTVRGVEPARSAASLPDAVGAARAAGADWLISLRLRRWPARGRIQSYGVQGYEVRVECTCRAFRAADGELVASPSVTRFALERDRSSALRLAATDAIRRALRRCFLSLASSESAP
jgi:tetratricopeptide (TPR) repeat protein